MNYMITFIAFISDIVNCEITVIHYWVDEHFDIDCYDNEKHIIYSDSYSRYKLQDDWNNDYALYRIENVFEELKTPGQWYFNKKNSFIYYDPHDGENTENINAEIPVTDSLLNISSTPDIKSGGITFNNIIFECTASGFKNLTSKRYGKIVKSASSPQGTVNLSGAENTVRYNIFAFGDLGLIGFVRGEPHIMSSFYKNIFITDDKPIIEGGYNFRFAENQVISDNNFFWDISGAPLRNIYSKKEGAGSEIQTWEHWQQTGHDNNSFYGEIGFKDLDSFTLSENSIVFEKGFPRDVTVSGTS